VLACLSLLAVPFALSILFRLLSAVPSVALLLLPAIGAVAFVAVLASCA
jgi:hypothetical protein